jgi:hypothetical protein
MIGFCEFATAPHIPSLCGIVQTVTRPVPKVNAELCHGTKSETPMNSSDCHPKK